MTTAEQNALTVKIAKYNEQIAELNQIISDAPDTTFGRIEKVESLREIVELKSRIERIERRLSDTPEPGVPTAEQVNLAAYATSSAYDNE